MSAPEIDMPELYRHRSIGVKGFSHGLGRKQPSAIAVLDEKQLLIIGNFRHSSIGLADQRPTLLVARAEVD
jgi:hypothetical protein